MRKRRRGKAAWRALAWLPLGGALGITAAMATDLPGWLSILAALLGAVATSSDAVAVRRPQRERGGSLHISASGTSL